MLRRLLAITVSAAVLLAAGVAGAQHRDHHKDHDAAAADARLLVKFGIEVQVVMTPAAAAFVHAAAAFPFGCTSAV